MILEEREKNRPKPTVKTEANGKPEPFLPTSTIKAFRNLGEMLASVPPDKSRTPRMWLST